MRSTGYIFAYREAYRPFGLRCLCTFRDESLLRSHCPFDPMRIIVVANVTLVGDLVAP